MNTQLQIKVLDKYGSPLIYPVCEQAKLFCELLKQKTFTDRDTKILKKLGYTFVIQQADITI